MHEPKVPSISYETDIRPLVGRINHLGLSDDNLPWMPNGTTQRLILQAYEQYRAPRPLSYDKHCEFYFGAPGVNRI